MKTTCASLLAASSLLALAGTAVAQPAAAPIAPAVATQAAAPAPEAKNSINVSPLSLLIGGVNINFEHQFKPGRGVIVEGGAYSFSITDGQDEVGYRSASLGVGYRYHWNERQHGGFVGAMLAQEMGSADVSYRSGDEMVTESVSYGRTSLTGNVGYRWMLGDQFNITLRIGIGGAVVSAESESSTAEDKFTSARGTSGALDGELSFGFNF